VEPSPIRSGLEAGYVDTAELLASGAVLLAAYVLRAVTGFGSALVAVPLLAFWLPLTLVVPWIVAFDVLAALILTTTSLMRAKDRVLWWEILRLLLPASLGSFLGIKLLIQVPQEAALCGLGLLVILFGGRILLHLQAQRRISAWWSLPAGGLGGAIGALFAIGGPPFVIYLSHRTQDKGALRATLSVLFLLEGAARMIFFAASGLLFQADLPQAMLLGLPVMLCGLYAGNQIHLRLSPTQVIRLMGLLLILVGATLVWRSC